MDEENRFQTWLSQYIKPLNHKRRKEIIDHIRTESSPGFDYFFLVILSTTIATLGLINDSPAVIIGAMLVAPLMSPILGVGLGSITADTKLTRDSATALIRGGVLSILLSILLTLSNKYLPFVPSLLEIPHEILSRTRPTPNDLLIALAGGLAASYALAQPHLSAALPGVAIATALMPPLSAIGVGIALGRWDIAGGATLLFITNAITIAFSATLVFFLQGFVPRYQRKNGKLPRSLLIAGILTGLLLIPLTYLGARLVSESQQNRIITNIIETELTEITDAELVELTINRTGDELQLGITIRSYLPPRHAQVLSLQQALVTRLDQPVTLTVTHVRAETFDPLLPPTYTPSPTLGPSPTWTVTPSQTSTTTPTVTATVTPSTTPTIITPSPTPKIAWVINTGVPPYYNLYEEPGGSILSVVSLNTVLYDLHETVIYDGIVWVKVMDESDQIGWFPQRYLQYPTLTPTPTPTNAN